MFKVLIISYYFPPMGLSGVQRTLKFAKYMKDYNWEPTVLTTGRSGYYYHDLSLLMEAEQANIKIIRTESFDINSFLGRYGTIPMPPEFFRKFVSGLGKFLFIPDSKKSWAKKMYKTAKNLLTNEEFDAIFISIPPFSAFLYATKLKKQFDIPVFVDYRDLWFGNHFWFYPTPYHRYKHRKLEDTALRSVEKVIVVNRRIKEKLLTLYKFLSFEDIIIIPHGFDPQDFSNTTTDRLSSKKMILTYSGIFYENITPKYFLKAFGRLVKERPDVASNIELHFVGFFRKENRRLVKKLNLKPFVLEHGYLNHTEAIRKISSSDVLWLMLGKKEKMSVVSAGKLYEYFGSRKPIIACLPEGASRDSAKSYGASFLTDPDNIQEIKETILKVHELHVRGNLPKPDDEFVNEFNRKTLTSQLVKQFQFYLKEEE